MMLEKIEITQRFNFKKINRHYECFIIDLMSKKAYFKINERIYNDKFIEKSYSCDNSWVDILSDLKNNVSSDIINLDDLEINKFKKEFNNLNLFDDFTSEEFSYFEKLESIYSCNINLYFDGKYMEYCIKNNFPNKWMEFSNLLIKLVNFDVLNIGHLKKLVTCLFFDIKSDGIYDKSTSEKLTLSSLEFGHYESYPHDTPHPSCIVDFKNNEIKGYFEKKFKEDVVRDLLEKYGVYLWIFKDYQIKSHNHDNVILDGYEWYLELVFNNSIIWTILGHNEYPDTYVCLAFEIEKLTGFDLCELETFSDDDLKLFKYYGNMKLS